MDPILQIAITLFVAKIFGEIAGRLRLPSLIGYLAAGILLTQTGVITQDAMMLFGTIGLILLLFISAFKEVSTEELLKHDWKGILLDVLGVLVSLGLGILVGQIFGLDWLASVLIGTGLAATSISVALGTFISTGKLNTNVGRTVLKSAIMDDIFALLILAIVAGVAVSGSFSLLNIGKIIGGIAFFAVLVVILGKAILWIMQKVRVMKVEEAVFSFVFVIVLLMAFMAQALGLSSVIGAFFAGMVLARVPSLETKQFVSKLSAISYGFFIPFFFVWVGAGMQFGVEAFSWFTLMLILAAIVGKMLSSFLGYKITEFSLKDLLIMGVARVPRGEIILIVATLGVSLEIITSDVFNSMLMLAVVTIIATPLVLTQLLKKIEIK